MNAHDLSAVASTASDADSNPIDTRHIPFKMRATGDLRFIAVPFGAMCQIGNHAHGEFTRAVTRGVRGGGWVYFDTESDIKKTFVLGFH